MRHLLSLAVAAALAMASPACAADSAGVVVRLVPTAKASSKDGVRVLAVGSEVFLLDLIGTGPAGRVHIRLTDNTCVVVGPNTVRLIDRSLFRGGAGAAACNGG